MRKPYLALDIETSGLVKENWEAPEVLSLAMIWDDLQSPLDQLDAVHLIIAPDHDRPLEFENEKVRNMHSELARKIDSFRARGKSILHVEEKHSGKTVTFCRKNLAAKIVSEFILDIFSRHGTIEVAGKSVEMFDLYVLNFNGLFNRRMKVDNRDVISNRCIDLGNLYFDASMPDVPTWKQVLQLVDQTQGVPNRLSHNALSDAFDVVRTVRNKLRGPG